MDCSCPFTKGRKEGAPDRTYGPGTDAHFPRLYGRKTNTNVRRIATISKSGVIVTRATARVLFPVAFRKSVSPSRNVGYRAARITTSTVARMIVTVHSPTFIPLGIIHLPVRGPGRTPMGPRVYEVFRRDNPQRAIRTNGVNEFGGKLITQFFDSLPERNARTEIDGHQEREFHTFPSDS